MNPIIITVAQISQMIVGVAVTVIGCYLIVYDPEDCTLGPDNNIAALVMYGSYLFLFLQFFVQRYFGKKRSDSSTKKGAASKDKSTVANGSSRRRKEE